MTDRPSQKRRNTDVCLATALVISLLKGESTERGGTGRALPRFTE
jgi:hypothetical protein